MVCEIFYLSFFLHPCKNCLICIFFVPRNYTKTTLLCFFSTDFKALPVCGGVSEGGVEGGGLGGGGGGGVVGRLLGGPGLVLPVGGDAPQAPQADGEPVVACGGRAPLPVEPTLLEVGIHPDTRHLSPVTPSH